MLASCRSFSGPSRSGRGDRAMTNIEKLARLIVRLGKAETTMEILSAAMEEETHGNDVRAQRSVLLVSDIPTLTNPASVFQEAG